MAPGARCLTCGKEYRDKWCPVCGRDFSGRQWGEDRRPRLIAEHRERVMRDKGKAGDSPW